jgi:hypothetical protein
LNWGGKHTVVVSLFPNLFSFFLKIFFFETLNYTAFDACQRTLLFSKAGANVLLFFIRASPKSKKNPDYLFKR